MANNGFLIGDSCLSPSDYAISYCVGKPLGFNNTTTNGFICNSSEKWVRASPSSYNCEIPGPPLTETRQIEAINALFPSAIAILAIAWGFKYIRVLVAEWLKERNASD